MFIEVACIAAGVPVGYRTKKLPTFVSLIGKMTTWAVYALLFLLGLSLGNNDAVFARIPELGLRSLVISVFALLGSVGITFFVERFCLRDTLSIPQESSAHAPSSNHAENPTERSCPIQASSLQQASPFQGTIAIVMFFISGIIIGRFTITPDSIAQGSFTMWALYVLLFLVGIGIGFDTQAWKILRQLHIKVALIPLGTAVGTFIGSTLAWCILSDMSLRDTLAVGAGFGYYSLSSILITNLGDAALGSVALLANVIREIITLVATPLLVRYFGKLAPLASGGAASMDTCLPVIARYSGERVGILSVFQGITLTVAVPILVTALLTW